MADLKTFLKENVEEYLFEDLNTMKWVSLPPGKTTGALGYPILMATFAGIELLGTLVSPTTFSGTVGGQYFYNFWKDYLYKGSPQGDMGALIYKLTRNGLMHLYAVKGSITVTRNEPNKHLKYDTYCDVIYIDSIQLANDLIHVYKNDIQPLITKTGGTINGFTMADRLKEIESDYNNKMSNIALNLGRMALPYTPSPTPVAQSTLSPPSSGSILFP